MNLFSNRIPIYSFNIITKIEGCWSSRAGKSVSIELSDGLSDCTVLAGLGLVDVDSPLLPHLQESLTLLPSLILLSVSQQAGWS